MQIALSQPQVTVVQAQKHLSNENATQFHHQLVSTLSSQQNSIVLVDMEQVKSVDSEGLLALVTALTLARKRNCRLSLCSINPSVRLIFEVTQLDQIFEIFDDRTAFQAEVG